MKFQIYREQQLQCTLAEAWDFFTSPKNLANITPQDMAFTVLSDYKEEPIYEGMLIDYTVSPLLKIPLRWKTRITEVDFQKSFTDFQLQGPYKLWNHRHEFIANKEGVLMKDTVDYELSFGFLGVIVHQVIVKNKLAKIFDYRFQVLDNLFNPSKTL